MERDSNRGPDSIAGKDGGTENFVYEVGTNKNITPFPVKARGEPLQGLVGWWTFDEGNGTTAYDSSGFGNNGTLTNFNWTATSGWTTGKIGKALSFDGVDDYVGIPHSNSLDLVNAFTVSVWVKYNTLSQAEVILWKGTGYDPTYGLGTIAAENGFRYWWTKSGVRYSSNLIPIQAGIWNYIVFTYDGSIMKCYLNGVDRNVNNSVSAPLDSFAQSLLIGKRLISEYVPFNGLIDEVRIYNRALSADEIKVLYDATK
jgi:hypothetical protein